MDLQGKVFYNKQLFRKCVEVVLNEFEKLNVVCECILIEVYGEQFIVRGFVL